MFQSIPFFSVPEDKSTFAQCFDYHLLEKHNMQEKQTVAPQNFFQNHETKKLVYLYLSWTLLFFVYYSMKKKCIYIYVYIQILGL